MSKRYLVLPVNDVLPKKHYRLLTSDTDTLVYDFDASLDFENPRFDSYADITRFGDAALVLRDDDGAVIPHRESDRFPTMDEIKDGALKNGMSTLRMSATRYVMNGITSVSEMAKVSFEL